MKITKQQLRRLIQETISSMVEGVNPKVAELEKLMGGPDEMKKLMGLTADEISAGIDSGNISIDLIDNAIKAYEDLKKGMDTARGGS